jgi:hypothetical protein
MEVILKEKIETIEIFTTDGVLICTHKKAIDKGRTISNSNHGKNGRYPPRENGHIRSLFFLSHENTKID